MEDQKNNRAPLLCYFKLVVWQHQTIIWTNDGFSWVRFCDIHLRAISQQVPKVLFCIMSLKILLLKLLPHLPGVNELTHKTTSYMSRYNEALVHWLLLAVLWLILEWFIMDQFWHHKWFIGRQIIQGHSVHSIFVRNWSGLEFMGKLCNVCYKHFGQKLPCYNETLL